jgi:hypothetical protein
MFYATNPSEFPWVGEHYAYLTDAEEDHGDEYEDGQQSVSFFDFSSFNNSGVDPI